jgi:hypothetical protein
LKVDPKSVVLGSLISLLLFAGLAYAQSLRLEFQASFKIPTDEGIVTTSYSADSLDFGTLNREYATAKVTIMNAGLEHLSLMWSVEGLPTNMEIQVQRKHLPSGGLTMWEDETQLDRGRELEILVTIRDKGASPGEHGFTFIVEAG